MNRSNVLTFAAGALLASLVAWSASPEPTAPLRWEYRVVEQEAFSLEMSGDVDGRVRAERRKYESDEEAREACSAAIANESLQKLAADGWHVLGGFAPWGHLNDFLRPAATGHGSPNDRHRVVILGRLKGIRGFKAASLNLQPWADAVIAWDKKRDEEYTGNRLDFEQLAFDRKAAVASSLQEILNKRAATGAAIFPWIDEGVSGAGRHTWTGHLVEYIPTKP